MVTRLAVLQALSGASDASGRETTTITGLAAALDADKTCVRTRVQGLADCDLAKLHPDGRVRVTITGQQLLALRPEGPVIVGPSDGVSSE